MPTRPAVVLGAALAALAPALVPPVAAAQGPVPPPPAPPAPTAPTAPAGVTAGGVDLSGLNADQAIAKLDAELRPRVKASLRLAVAGRRYTLTAKQAHVGLDTVTTAKRAVAARPGTTAVPVVLSHRRKAVRSWVDRIAAGLGVAPRDATVRIRLRSVRLRRGRSGLRLDARATAKAVDLALADQTGRARSLRTKLVKVRPGVDARAARRRYATVITVDKAHFRLRLFKHFKVVKRYGVAVGQPAYPTPSGLFSIANKQVNPTWSVPNSPWAGELQGTTVQGGSAANPLKARWMGIADGVGIHGTGEDWSIGTRASHGCIRMHVSDVIDLYPRVPVGTPVLLG
jgi:lipoprotein-anchoring transpeptidase ErfK/SrfK